MCIRDSFLKSHKYGTSGWIAEKTGDIHMAKGQTVTPGSAYVQCSHRSELAGILAGLCYIIDICATFGVTHGSITLGFDGLGALDAIKKTHNSKYTIKNNRNHFDILTAIKQLIRCIPDIDINFVHI